MICLFLNIFSEEVRGIRKREWKESGLPGLLKKCSSETWGNGSEQVDIRLLSNETNIFLPNMLAYR